MKTINYYINEKLKLSSQSKLNKYKFYPKDFNELRSLLRSLLKKRGKDADLNDIDVSKVTTFYDEHINRGLFDSLDPHNIDISKWDVSNVEDMSHMFFGCENFNCNLSNWHVENVRNMNYMFFKCIKFTGEGLEKWKTLNLENVDYMFLGVKNLIAIYLIGTLVILLQVV